MMFWDHGGWGSWDWLAMSMMMVAFWGLVIALILWVTRSARTGRTTDTARAHDVLAERFARGEIDAEEFTHRRELLHTGSRGGPTAGAGPR